MRISLLTQTAMAATLALAASPAMALSFTYADITVPNATDVFPTAVNDHGTVVGYYIDTVGNVHGFTDKAGVIAKVDYPSAATTTLVGIDMQGTAAGEEVMSNGVYGGFYWSKNKATPIPVAYVQPLAMGEMGQMVGNTLYNGQNFGFVAVGTALSLVTPAGDVTFVSVAAINRAASIVGSYTDSTGHLHGLRGTASNAVGFDYPASLSTQGVAISDSYEWANYVDFQGNQRGTRVQGDSYANVNASTTGSTYLTTADHKGNAAGWTIDGRGQRGFYYSTKQVITRFDPPGSRSTLPTWMNNTGEIVGTYQKKGHTIGFIATCVKTSGTATCAP